MKKSMVASIPIDRNYKQALERIWQHFSNVPQKIKASKKIFIKICIDHLHQHRHTNLELLQSLLEQIRKINPSCHIFVMENNIHGSFTRLLANVLGIIELIKPYKAKFIYLDEKKATSIAIGSEKNPTHVDFPRMLVDDLISDRKNCFYFNVANLKTHFQTKFAGGLFNQIGFILLNSHRFIHSHYLHQTIVDLLEYVQPDFTIVDANIVTAHGTLSPESLIDQYSHSLNRLLAGVDPVAVDRVAVELLKYSASKIVHLRLAGRRGLGESELDNIDIKGSLTSRDPKIPYMVELSQLPQKMDIVIGKNRSGIETCLGISLQFAQIIYKDFAGNGRFTLITGTEFSEQQLENLFEPLIILGLNTCKEIAAYIKSHYQHVYYIYYCDDLPQIMAVLAKVLGTSKYNLIGVTPWTIWKHLFIGKLHGLKYQVPFIDSNTKTWKIPKKKRIFKKIKE